MSQQSNLFSKPRPTRDPMPRGTYAGSSKFWQTLMNDERDLVRQIDFFILNAKQGLGLGTSQILVAGQKFDFVLRTLRNHAVWKKYGIKFYFAQNYIQIWFKKVEQPISLNIYKDKINEIH